MQERTYEKVETLWPYGGFTVRAVESKLGEGRLTLTGKSLLFERNDGLAIGFGFPNLQQIRLKDVHTVELAYSLQGELRTVLFRVLCTFPDGTARDDLPARDEPYRMSLLRAITGGVVARFLADHSDARTEGLSKMEDEKFEARVKDLRANVALFPDKKQFEDNVWWDEDLRRRSLEAAESEPAIWDDPYRDRLFYTGTNPTMTVDNAFEKLDLLQEDWVNGRLDPRQRARSAATDYLIVKRMSELGYMGVHGEPSSVWSNAADRLVQNEGRVGTVVLRFL
ncbi:MAG: hypothetical protein OK456_09375 [Thaumarchaeota archaeon]|nr:hypothetical protein [Nitrososphaerota archaeon]